MDYYIYLAISTVKEDKDTEEKVKMETEMMHQKAVLLKTEFVDLRQKVLCLISDNSLPKIDQLREVMDKIIHTQSEEMQEVRKELEQTVEMMNYYRCFRCHALDITPIGMRCILTGLNHTKS